MKLTLTVKNNDKAELIQSMKIALERLEKDSQLDGAGMLLPNGNYFYFGVEDTQSDDFDEVLFGSCCGHNYAANNESL